MEGSAGSLRFENNDLRIVTLGLESFTSEKSARHVFKVAERILATPTGENYEQRYVEEAGFLHTDRIAEAGDLRRTVHAKLAPEQTKTVKLAGQNFKLGIAKIGDLPSLRYVGETFGTADPAPEEVEIQVRAVAIESRDYRRAMGKTQKIQFGNAVAGTVEKAGAGSGFEVGTPVFSIGKDTFRSKFRAAKEYIHQIPEGIAFTDATFSVPALAAAYYAIVEVGRWRKGDKVLIYHSAGFIGRAAIKISQKLGAQFLATVHDETESKELTASLGVPETSIVSHKAFTLGHDQSFSGVDIVLCTEPVANQIGRASCRERVF